MTATPLQSLHRRTHSLTSALLLAANAAHNMHGHFLSGTHTDAIGHLMQVIQHLHIAMQDRREISRLIKKGVVPRPAAAKPKDGSAS